MNQYDIRNTILLSIYNGCWLKIHYQNKENIQRYFLICVKHIHFDDESLICDSLSLDTNKTDPIEISIFIERILEARLIENTFFENNQELICLLNENITEAKKIFPVIEYDCVLNYLEECVLLDTPPFKTELDVVLGIDKDVLEKEDVYHLTPTQANQLKHHLSIQNNSFHNKQLAVNLLTLKYPNNKHYVLAYKPVKWNITKKELFIEDKVIYNPRFQTDNGEYQISEYLSEEDQVLLDNFEQNYEVLFNKISQRVNNSETILEDTSYLIFIERDAPVNIKKEFDGIRNMYQKNEVTKPIKAFFGEIESKTKNRKFFPFCLINHQLNPSQLLSIFIGLKDDVSFIQGPPGTGKTSTVVNIVTSAFFNQQRVIVVTNNNQPMKDLKEKFEELGNYGDKKIELPICRLSAKKNMDETIKYMNHLYFKYKDATVKEDILIKNSQFQKENTKIVVQKLNEYDEYLQQIKKEKYIEQFIEKDLENDRLALLLLSRKIENIEELDYDFEKLKQDAGLSETAVKSFLYFYSAKCLQKLDKPRYNFLKKMICIDLDNAEELQKSVDDFIEFLKDEDNVELLLDIFPIVFSTNLSASKLGIPRPYFDYCIMDEAGQCNVATSMIPIVRAQKLILVGDVQQLQPVILLNKKSNEELKEKYNIGESFSYIENSIYSTMRKNAPYNRESLLDVHYRCDSKIIGFCNQKYYADKLNIQSKQVPNSLEFLKTENEKVRQDKNVSFEEVKKIKQLLQLPELENKSIGIITPFVAQKKLLEQEITLPNKNSSIGTIHTFQGNEKDIIIFSSAITNYTTKGTYYWLKNNKQLINVAVSRAKEKLIMLGNEKKILEFHAKTIFKNEEEKDDIYDLYQYVLKNGNYKVIPNTIPCEALGTENEGTFQDKARFSAFRLALSVIDINSKYKEKVPVRNVIIEYTGDLLFDFVIYNQNMPTLVIQLQKAIKQNFEMDKIKELCEKNHITYQYIMPNEVRSYFSIKSMLKDEILLTTK